MNNTPVKRRRMVSARRYRQIVAASQPKRAAVREIPRPALWRGRRPDGTTVLLCGEHLVSDCVTDTAPAVDIAGVCVKCTAPVRISGHCFGRWVERVTPGSTAREARFEIAAFVASAQATAQPPKWVGVGELGDGCEMLLSGRWPGVALVVKVMPSGNRYALTVLTAASAPEAV